MRRFLIAISSSSTEHAYILDILPSGSCGSLVRNKTHDIDDLKQDIKDCIESTDAGIEGVMNIVDETGSWTSEISLSDECAARLGWFE